MSSDSGITRRVFLDSSGRIMLGAAAGCALGGAAAGAAGARKACSDSYCGLYCGACKALIDSEKAKDADDVKCLGCKSRTTAGWCSKCEIRACAQGKGAENCADCNAYPCKKLKAFHHNGRDYRLLGAKNCDAIREHGASAWLKERKARWTCKACGTRLSWKDDACPKCGKDILSCKEEAAAWRDR